MRPRLARRALAALLLFAAVSLPAQAIDRIRARIDSISVGEFTAHEVRAVFNIPSTRRSTLTLDARELDVPAALRAQIGRVTQLRVKCDNPAVREPSLSCPALVFDARAARLPPLHIDALASIDIDSGRAELSGQGPVLAGEPAVFTFAGTPQDWQAGASLPTVTFKSLLELIAPWYAPPPRFVPTGRAALSLTATSTQGVPTATLIAELRDVDYSNADGTVVAEKLRGNATLRVLSLGNREFALGFDSGTGQVLAGPVYVDLGANPLHLETQLHAGEGVVELTAIELAQRGLGRAGGEAVLRLEPFGIDTARLDIERLEFPAAYRSLLQIALTTTPFAQLETTGTASGSVRIAGGAPVAVDLQLAEVGLSDLKQQLDVRKVNAELHWTQGLTGPPRPSFLAWESSRGWGVTGGRSRVDFLAQDRDVRLVKPARLPLWDGALVVNQLEAQHIGTPELAGSFDAQLEPISLLPVTQALRWKEFGGKLAGRIPGLTYRDGLLSLQGDLVAEVFNGRVVARNLRVRDPLGAWPRLYADISARDLDLELLTRTFEFGSITGRLDGDLEGLETFDWSPVAFDLRLATPGRDKSRHRISQKAVKNLAKIGGDGGGVSAALQSGALRFFDNFRYDRIGLSCRLRNDVCEMSGVEPAKAGYYIVKGSGLPRIDIIGNQTRVDWPRLLAQIKAAVDNTEEVIIR
jgi:hypothetical protein